MIKLSLFTNDLVTYIKNPKELTKKILLELKRDYSKIEGYKVKIQKSKLFFCIPKINN